MNLKTQRNLYALLIVVLLGIIGTSVYSLLGGFDEISILHGPGERKSIIGKYFKGYYAHPDIEEMWKDSKALLDNGEIAGFLAVVNYQNDSLSNDEVEQFIGVAIAGGMAEVPAGYEVLETDLTQRVFISLPMHPLVRPRPHKVEDMIQKYANENGLTLAKFTIELHYRDNSLTVEAPIVSIQ